MFLAVIFFENPDARGHFFTALAVLLAGFLEKSTKDECKETSVTLYLILFTHIFRLDQKSWQ